MADGHDIASVAVLCGGVGAARFLRGLVRVIAPDAVTAIVNVGDDMVLHGLHISPDIDTVIYTLADEIDPDRGWGLRHETWQAMDTLGRYGDGAWFSLGDRDLGTHLERTRRLHEGAPLSDVTAHLARSWAVDVAVTPVSDDPIRTVVTLADGGDVEFQEYFVGRAHAVPITAVRFDGIADARVGDTARTALELADAVVIAPSNPIVSIAPVLDVPGVRDALAARAGGTVAISPIVGGAALKGPAARMLEELGHEPSVVGVAKLLADVCDSLVVDQIDAGRSSDVRAAGVVPYVTDTIMSTPDAAAVLARAALSAAGLGTTGRRSATS